MKSETSNKVVIKTLKNMGACDGEGDAIPWCKEHGGTWGDLWRDCQRGDWMIWYLEKTGEASKLQLRIIAAKTAQLVLPIYEAQYPNDSGVRDCINTCLREDATDEELKAAAIDAADAADAAYAAANAANAAIDAADAANAAANAANAANAAANAANAAYAAADAAYAAANAKTYAKIADIVREIIK